MSIYEAMESLGAFIRGHPKETNYISAYNAWISSGVVINEKFIPTLIAMARELVAMQELLREL